MINIKTLAEKISRKALWAKDIAGANKIGVFSFVFSFACMFMFIQITVNRNDIIRTLKSEISKSIANLNEIGIDVAYDNLEFDNIFIYPIVKIENLRLYNLKGYRLWQLNINNVSARPRLLRNRSIKFVSDGGATFKVDDVSYDIISQEAELFLSYNKDMLFSDAELYLNKLDIKNWAKIEKVTWIARMIKDKRSAVQTVTPSMESHIEIKDVSLNGLLDYPLTSNIRRMYAQFNLIGSLMPSDGFMVAAENWLQDGGYIDVPSLMVSWDPLLLVGRGDIRFNENFEPKIQIKTSSKAIMKLLNDLKDNKFLDRKGVFVANILLASKGFKLKDDDEYLTISTPIVYRDNKLTVENITVKTISPEVGQ